LLPRYDYDLLLLICRCTFTHFAFIGTLLLHTCLNLLLLFVVGCWLIVFGFRLVLFVLITVVVTRLRCLDVVVLPLLFVTLPPPCFGAICCIYIYSVISISSVSTSLLRAFLPAFTFFISLVCRTFGRYGCVCVRAGDGRVENEGRHGGVGIHSRLRNCDET